LKNLYTKNKLSNLKRFAARATPIGVLKAFSQSKRSLFSDYFID